MTSKKEIEKFKEENKEYLAARHETDTHLIVTRPGQDKPILDSGNKNS